MNPPTKNVTKEAKQMGAPPERPTAFSEQAEILHGRLIESISDHAIILLDAEGKIATWNNGAEIIFGFTKTEMLGRPFAELFDADALGATPADRPDAASAAGRATAPGKHERWMHRKDGGVFFASGSTELIHDEAGNVAGFSQIVRDKTTERKSEAALRQTMEEMERSNRAKDHFLAVLSHELRTPLSPVLMAVQFLATEPDLPEPVADALDVIRRNVELEARLIDDLLDVTRLARNNLQLNMAEINAHGIIANVLDICQSDATGKRHHVRTCLKADRPIVRGDSARLQQILWNLLKNAIKFTPFGGDITIQSANDATKEWLTIDVIDSGIGIEPGLLPNIFDAFKQGESTVTRKFSGLGLGLAIASSLAALHHGKLGAASEGKDKGSRFSLTLPAIPTAPKVDHAKAAVERYPKRLLRVLFVEDHKDTAQVMTRVLNRMGYDVSTASTVKEALDLANRERFDMLISDIGLPDGTGLDIITQIHPKLPAVALTGFGMDQDIARSKAAGFREHLTKPVNMDKLETVLRSLAQDAGQP